MAKIEGIAGKPKEWAWSYSKLKNFETCPKRHYEIDVLKSYIEDVKPGGPLDEGNKAHAALAKACEGTEPLPVNFSHYQSWVDRVRAVPGKLLVEQKYAITRDFRATTYFARDCWYRGIGDVVCLDGPIALILDWKTGKVLEDPVQLALMAQCIFSHYPEVMVVRSEYVWLKEECTTPEVFKRNDKVKATGDTLIEHWTDLLPRISKLEAASKSLTYPPKPGGLCKKYCVVTSCPFFGKGARG